MAQKQTPKEDSAASFEEALEKLEEIVADLEEGKLNLTDSLGRYEEGVKYLKACYESLREVERKIELVAGIDAEGRPVTKPFDDEATTFDEKPKSRSRRQSPASGGESNNVDDSVGLF